VAEREGFEPSIRLCRILTFQASAFDHSATAPHSLDGPPVEASSAPRNLAEWSLAPLCAAMMRRHGQAPTAEEIEALARRALEALPAPFAATLGDVVLMVEEFADEATLADVGIEDPFELTGLYEGIPLTERSVDQSGALPDRVRLFRRPILDEWAAGDDSLKHLVAHVLIHEIGHHFGLSDADMHALEEQVG
jgi:predicted Zn-dependent protease with MMP-like domain